MTVPTVERGLRLVELAGVGAQGLDVPALALCEDRVEGQRGLPRAGQTREDDHPVARQLDGDVFEIVLASPLNKDSIFHGRYSTWRRGKCHVSWQAGSSQNGLGASDRRLRAAGAPSRR